MDAGRGRDATACSYHPPNAQQLTGTDPRKSNTNGDGLAGEEEVDLAVNPTRSNTDKDGISDGIETKYSNDALKMIFG